MTAAVSFPHFVRRESIEQMPPPQLVHGPLAWMRRNLFSSVFNTILTLAVAYLLYVVIPPIIDFFFVDAVFTGADREACRPTAPGQPMGACWAYVYDKINYFTYGSYPISERWRVDVFFALLAIGVAWMLWLRAPRRDIGGVYFFFFLPLATYIVLTGGNSNFRTFAIGGLSHAFGGNFPGETLQNLSLSLPWISPETAVFWLDFAFTTLVFMAIAALIARLFQSSSAAAARFTLVGFAVLAVAIALLSFDFGLTDVPTALWGGILVTILVATVGIVFSLPFGILLALGRRSKLPIIKLLSVIFIEFVRGVPLITVLFMANTMLPLFLPDGLTVDRLARPLVGVALFASAYMAEVVRGGLQAMPKGQYEGAMSLGLNYPQMMVFIILPQSLRIVIPGIVNTFIGLFKDTSLVAIVGLFDLIKTIEASRVDPIWAAPTVNYTGYAFAAMFYFVFCFGMSRYSLSVERRLAAGQRR